MYLKCVRMNGFKSFAEKIELDLNKGISGVVGPNGSGKSNIVDAVRWVLGEQSVKALRGNSSMCDVIFAGSKSRDAQSRALVSLTFDNSDHYLNSEFDEVEIKRVVYRTGENEYFINNTRVRLKDVTDLFLDSGAGKESFNIISQGAVGDIINSKPEERRVIFEEAAGVLKYKKRKEESYRKLDRTNENLARVNLLIDELLTTLTPLKEQSEKAKKYLEFKGDLENIEIALIANDIEKINNDYLKVQERVKTLNEEVERITLSNTIDSSKVEKMKLDAIKLDQEIDEKNQLILNINREMTEIDSKKQITLERKKYEVDGNKIEENILSLQEEVLNINNSIEVSKRELEDLKKQLDVKQLRSMELIKVNDEKKNSRDKISNEILSNNKEVIILNNKIDILNDNINGDTKLPYSVKNILNNIRLTGIHDILGRLIEIPEKYVIAIETSLGVQVNVLVVDNEKCAKNAINYLKENKLGRATFFPISIIKGRNVLYEDLEKVKNVDGFIGTAASLVTYKDTYKEIVLNQLGNVIVVDNIDTMNKIGKIINYKYKIVTLDGDVQFAGGAMNGGTQKSTSSVMSQKFELEDLKKEKIQKEEKINSLEKELNDITKDIEDNYSKLEKNQKEVILLTEEINIKEKNLSNVLKNYEIKNNELNGLKDKKENKLDEELENLVNLYYEKSSTKEKEEKELDRLKSKKFDLANLINELEKSYRDMNSEITAKQNELKLEEIKLGKMDVKLDNLLLELNEDYSLTYEKAKTDYILDIEEDTARVTVNNLKAKIRSLGEVNTGSITEYNRINERYTFLTKQRDDLEKSIGSLKSVIEEMDELMKTRFEEVFEKISAEFKVVFKKLFKGGEGILELTNPDDLLNTGIEISALPPGKKLNSISMLSGGEKTLTAIALLFAILNVKPVPFVILDEVEAALDDANVVSFGNYLLSCKEKSQFIIITHKKKTMEFMDVLYGVTMQESGVSKLVSVKLEG